MTDPTFGRPSSPPPLSPLRLATARSVPSPLRCLTPTRSPVPAVQSPSHTRGTCPPPFDYDARERLLGVLTLGWVRALVRRDGGDTLYSDELMYRVWLCCDGLVDSLLVRLARLKGHQPFHSLDALVEHVTTQYDNRRLPALPLPSNTKQHDDNTTSPWTVQRQLAKTAVPWEQEQDEEDAMAAALGVQSPRLTRMATLPAMPYLSAMGSRSPSMSPTLSLSPSQSPSLGYSTLSLDCSPTPSPPIRPMLPFLAGMPLTASPPLLRSVSAQSVMGVTEAGRPSSRQRQQWWTHAETAMEGISLSEALPPRRLQPQISAVREEQEH